MNSNRAPTLHKHGGIFGNIVFDLILLGFAISLVLSPIWFDISDIVYQITGLQNYVVRNFVPSSLYNYWLVIPLGVIGIWRWTVWLIKKIVASFYSPILPESNDLNLRGTNNLKVSIIEIV